jgi:hypothetical protein
VESPESEGIKRGSPDLDSVPGVKGKIAKKLSKMELDKEPED